jgi:1-acyl-sn-glycerol-3-phosphate acyltransferase
MVLARSLVYSVLFFATTAVFTILGSPLLLGPRRYAMLALKVHARCCLWLLRVIVGTTYEVRGLRYRPVGAALVASKHQSAWDTFALMPLFDDPSMVMKAELGWIPFYGWFARKFGHIFVVRAKAAIALKALIGDARARAADGRQIIIFPEGTRRSPDAAPDYKPGVVALYEGLALPCVPVALNSGLFWPRRQVWRYPGTIIVEFLEPIPAGLDRRTFRKLLERRIEEATDRLVREGRTGSPVIATTQTQSEQT